MNINKFLGSIHVPRIILDDVNLLIRYINFYVEEFETSYSIFYDVEVAPFMLLHYIDNKIIFLKFNRQALYFVINLGKRKMKHLSNHPCPMHIITATIILR